MSPMQSAVRRRALGEITAGMWVTVDGALGVVFKCPAIVRMPATINVEVEDDSPAGFHMEPREVMEGVSDASRCEVHFVDDKGVTIKERLVPIADARQAVLADMGPLKARGSFPSLAQAYRLNYDLSPEARAAYEADERANALKSQSSANAELVKAVRAQAFADFQAGKGLDDDGAAPATDA